MQPLTGKNILVSGSTRGIGRSIAEQLVSLGATVGINGRKTDTVEKACREIGQKQTIPLPYDLAEEEAGSRLVDEFLSKTDSIEALINNAGSGKAAPFRAMTTERWQNTFRLNTEAAMTASRQAYSAMRKQGRGSIVNIASISAHGPGKWMGADYAASKAALISMTKSLAFEAARFGVRVNAVSPGFIDTEMTEVVSGEMRDSLPIPMKRFGRPKEVADAVIWLISEDSAYITGQVVHVDGGLFT